MKKITKIPEPREWIEYRNAPGVSYEPNPELRDALLKEQGYICAYCMSRIGLRGVHDGVRIEHLVARNGDYIEGVDRRRLSLDYSNMVACCNGSSNGEEFCDISKGNKDIPLFPHRFDIFSDATIDTISYKSMDGTIESSDPDWNVFINKTLNLNTPILKRNRLETYKGLQSNLERYSLVELNKQLKKWESRDKNNQYRPYCGVALYFLKKWKRKYR